MMIACCVVIVFLSVVCGITNTIDDVEHVIIFMQENRAFDHYYGSLSGVRGFADKAAMLLSSNLNSFYQPMNPFNFSQYQLPWALDSSKTKAVCSAAPEMSYPTDILMWNYGALNAWNTARETGLGMGFYSREDLEYYYALADEFVVCDQYFQSTFTETNPNRLHLFTGSNGLSVGEQAVLENWEPTPGFNWTTMGEILENSEISWKVYQEQDNFDDNGFAWFKNYQDAKPGNPLYDKGMARVDNIVTAFDDDMKSGKLPQVSWIIAPTAYSEHSSNKPPYGEFLSSQLLKVLSENEDVYKKSIFILNYDEGGQYFDHSWTPTPPVSKKDGISTVTTKGEVNFNLPIGLGFRVPLIAISPWSRGNIVNSQVFDHTSTIQFIEKRFNVYNPNISPWRREVAGDLTSIFNFSSPDYSWPTLPDTSGYIKKADQQCATLPYPHPPKVQTFPKQEPGVRISRALPYQFSIDGVSMGDEFQVQFQNIGEQTGVFYVYNYLEIIGAEGNPAKFTVSAGKSIDYQWPLKEGKYHLGLYGPNGFVRQFSGDNTDIIDTMIVNFLYVIDMNSIDINAQNTGSETLNVQILSNDYITGKWNFVVSPGEKISHIVNVKSSGHWYDITVLVSTNHKQLSESRFMGRMETGVDSISDPSLR